VFISFEEKERIAKFARQYKLNNRENIVFLEDRKGEFSKLFDVHSIPYIVIYDSNGKFLKKFKGITKINDVLKVLE
jgi:thioredoxin-related protein